MVVLRNDVHQHGRPSQSTQIAHQPIWASAALAQWLRSRAWAPSNGESHPGNSGDQVTSRTEHGWATGPDRRILTGATVITIVRTLGAVGLALTATTVDPELALPLLLASLAVYWAGDMLDGFWARWRHQETRFGAILDVVTDRVCSLAFYLGLVWLRPELSLPIGVYVIEFAVVDTILSLAFVLWPLLSPNYFHLVDNPIWRWNWSKPAKAINSAAFALLLIFTDAIWLGVAIALVLLALKLTSLVRLVRIGIPVPPMPDVVTATS